MYGPIRDLRRTRAARPLLLAAVAFGILAGAWASGAAEGLSAAHARTLDAIPQALAVRGLALYRSMNKILGELASREALGDLSRALDQPKGEVRLEGGPHSGIRYDARGVGDALPADPDPGSFALHLAWNEVEAQRAIRMTHRLAFPFTQQELQAFNGRVFAGIEGTDADVRRAFKATFPALHRFLRRFVDLDAMEGLEARDGYTRIDARIPVGEEDFADAYPDMGKFLARVQLFEVAAFTPEGDDAFRFAFDRSEGAFLFQALKSGSEVLVGRGGVPVRDESGALRLLRLPESGTLELLMDFRVSLVGLALGSVTLTTIELPGTRWRLVYDPAGAADSASWRSSLVEVGPIPVLLGLFFPFESFYELLQKEYDMQVRIPREGAERASGHVATDLAMILPGKNWLVKFIEFLAGASREDLMRDQARFGSDLAGAVAQDLKVAVAQLGDAAPAD